MNWFAAGAGLAVGAIPEAVKREECKKAVGAMLYTLAECGFTAHQINVAMREYGYVRAAAAIASQEKQ